MWVTAVLLCLATSAYARPEIIRPDEDAVELQALAQLPQELQDFKEAEAQPDDLNRKKKEVTTFCVEIRTQDHKPFQVCDPYHEKEYYPKHQHEGGDNHIKSKSDHSGGGKPAFSTPIKTYASPESSRPPSKQSFEGFQSNFPEVQNIGPAREASEDEMQIENELPSQGAAKANKEEHFDVPVPVRSAFEDENELNEDEDPSKSSPARSASDADTPAEIQKADTPVDDPTHEEVNEASKDIGKAVKPSDEKAREAVNVQQDDVKEEVKSDIKEDIKEDVKEDVKEKDLTQIRAAEQADAYKPKMEYGHQTQYLPYSPIHQNHHSGLVITCQPNLAGYAHRVPDPYHQGGYHSGGYHSAYNQRAADPTFGRPYYRPQTHYGGYGGYKPYQPYRPQAHHYQGPAYPYPQPHHKAYKPEIHKMDPYKQEPHYKPPQKSYEYYPYAPAYPQQPHYKPSEGFGHKTEDKGEHHVRSSDVLERANEKDEQKPFEEETKEQHTLKKLEDISKQRLAESWVPDGMVEVFVGEKSPIHAQDQLSNVGLKPPVELNVDVNEAEEGGQRSADNDTPKDEEHIHPLDQVNVKEAEDGLRSASFGHPEGDNVHIHHNGDPKEIEDGGWRSASSPESDIGHFIHTNGANEAENGPWRSASHNHPLGDSTLHLDHNAGIQDAEGGWRSADYGPPGFELVHHNSEAKSAENGGWRSASNPAVSDPVPTSHNSHPVSDHDHLSHIDAAKSAENGGWRSANYPEVSDGHPVSDHDHPDHVAKSAENGGWRSAGYPAINDPVHPSHNALPGSDHAHLGHNGAAKSAENGGWRSAGYPAISDPVHPSHTDHVGAAKSAENGGWRSANDGFPGSEGDLTQDEGLRQAQGDNMETPVGQPNGSMKNIHQEEASRHPIENGSLENRIEES